MSELAEDPRVAELLLLLWDAPDREAGIAIVDLPDSLRAEDLLTACEGDRLIQFLRRNHCYHGGGPHRKLVLERGWSIAELHKPNRNQVWQLLEEAIGEDVPDEIRHRVRLGYFGSSKAARLALARSNGGEAFTLLERFPATSAGHVAFLQWVRDEVHRAAEAKRGQSGKEYSNATIESILRGIKWDEARRRVSKLSGLPVNAVDMVSSVLQRELSVGTVEQIDKLLTPSLRFLRSLLESASSRNSLTVMEPPELVELKRWISVDGVKGNWEHTISAAEYWGLDVDTRHRNIAFLLQQVIGGDPPENMIRDYLFRNHGIQPADPIDLEKLEKLLKADADRGRSSEMASNAGFAAATQNTTSTQPTPVGAGDMDEGEGDEKAKFRWTAPMLEGYVFALLKEVAYPTERDAVARIRAKAHKPAPSRTTLRKTYAWQNRPKKTANPSTTNEAQSGVSPAQSADSAASHEEVTNRIIDIAEMIGRQLTDDERGAVAWTIQQAGADEKTRDEAIGELIEGFTSGNK